MKKIAKFLGYGAALWMLYCGIGVVINMFNFAYESAGIGGVIVGIFTLPLAWAYYLIKAIWVAGFNNVYVLANVEFIVAVALTIGLFHFADTD
ncbi:MAG: hypothetical protein ACXABY_15980 [Candidatus Thorarchaeota archaeon]|jgi:hypothetical protein